MITSEIYEAEKAARPLFFHTLHYRDLDTALKAVGAQPERPALSPVPLLGAVAQYDKTQIVARLRGARLRKKAQEGRCESRKPYGHRDGEQQILARMPQLRAEGMAYYVIADQLNAAGFSARSGGQWDSKVVWRILKREP